MGISENIVLQATGLKKADLRKYGIQIGPKYGLLQVKRSRRKSILNTVLKMRKHGMETASIAEVSELNEKWLERFFKKAKV